MMAADQFLCGRQPETCAIRPVRDQRIKYRALQLRRNARSVVFNFYAGDCLISCFAYCEIHDRAAPKDYRALSVQRVNSVSHEVKKRLHQLVAVKIDQRQTGIIIAPKIDLITGFCLNQAHHIFEQFMHIGWLFVWWPTRAKQRVHETGETVNLVDDDARVFLKLFASKLFAEYLRCTTNSAEWVFYFVCQLANHLPACAVLNKQRVFAADS